MKNPVAKMINTINTINTKIEASLCIANSSFDVSYEQNKHDKHKNSLVFILMNKVSIYP